MIKSNKEFYIKFAELLENIDPESNVCPFCICRFLNRNIVKIIEEVSQDIDKNTLLRICKIHNLPIQILEEKELH